MGDPADLLDEAQALVARYTGIGARETRTDAALRYISTITPKTPAGQAAVGGTSGCLTGYLLMRIGKTAAFSVGSALLGLQLAHYYGYVKVDWKRIHKDLGHKGTGFVRRSRAAEFNQKSIVDFIKQNVPLSGGFVGGFLIGIALT